MSDNTPAQPKRRDDAKGQPPASACPVCQTVTAASDPLPFCSTRCRQIDLGRWLDGSYRITRPISQSDVEDGV